MLTLILLIAGIIDLRYRKIPFFIILLLFAGAVIYSKANLYLFFGSMIKSVIVIALPLFFIGLATDKVKGGDIKFLSVLGMALGITHFIWVLIFATGYAVIYSAITKQKSIPLAFFVLLGYLSVGILKFIF